MAMNESRTESEGQQENESDCGESYVGDRLAFTTFGGLGAVATGVEEAVFEGPVLGQIVPAVILLFPAVMAKSSYQRGGKGWSVQGSDPEPFMLGRFGLKLAAT